MLLNRELKPAVKVTKLLKTPVILPARSPSGPINMIGRQQIATLNGPNSEIPRWTPFVTGGSLFFPTFFEDPGSAAADNKYKDVLFNFEGQQFTFPAYHAEVMKMFR